MKHFDVIVAIGGGINSEGKLTNTSQERTSIAADLYLQGLAEKIVMSGKWWHRLVQCPPVTEAYAMARLASAHGVPGSDIFLEEKSTDTIGNAYFTKTDILEPNGWKRIALVTSFAHQARTRMIFEHVLGPEYSVTNYPTLSLCGPAEMASEVTKIDGLASNLRDIEPGDSQAILKRFQYIGQVAALAS